uniref:Reverse transcriptase domain-containing protein n=1 Tax=Nicotiana tabacum TaxID=4097 RepID=A0A1S4BUZ3_TOBAC|nr:PREDICTED: uncharacterized protein LOC107812184 [Nicotiana tabacum]
MSCASGTGQIMQLRINVPLKTPLHTSHDLVTHNVAPVEIDKALMEQQQFEDEGDDESTAENFNKMAREVDLSRRASSKVGGEFKVVLHEDEKIGGLPVYPPEYEKFAFCVNSSGLFDLGYKGIHSLGGMEDPMLSNLFSTIEVEHLIRIGSDNAPLFLRCGEQASNYVKPFKFLKFWTKHEFIKDVVRQNWHVDFICDPFLMFKSKLNNVKVALSQWSKVTYGDIFKKLAILKDIVKVKEMLFEEEPIIANRIALQHAQVESKKYLNIGEQYWKQKTGMTWRKLQLKRIQNGGWDRIDDQVQLDVVVVDFYQNHFTKEGDPTNFSLLGNVPSMVIVEQNMELCRYPTLEEIKGTVFELSGDSVRGPDGYTGTFYQDCWEIIGYNIHNMVLHFYGGATLPKSITHTKLVLLPKKPMVQTFSDLRPISLSNFIYKEIVTDKRLRAKPANVVIKLDMAKAYDRGSSSPQEGFSAVVLSMSLNKLFEDKSFVWFGMPKWFEPLNHLAYAENTIICASAHSDSLKKVMTILGSYERISGQLINKAKSSYYMHVKAVNSLFQEVGDAIGFARGEFPFTYLGCPIFYTRRRKDYYNDLIKKVKAKLHSWKGKLLSFGGKATLISSVLQSMPVHFLSVLDPPDNIIEYLHKMFARFFWSTKEEGRGWHWASWQKLCLPEEEGGLGFRSLHDISRALFSKLW